VEKINILMIEDDSELAEILGEFLQKEGFSCLNYEDPFSARIALSGGGFDLVILDLTLPGIDGLEVCKDIRIKYDIPIIISSARGDIDDKIEALKSGADDYIPKPYDPKELKARIEAVMRRYKNINQKNETVSSPLVIDSDSFSARLDGVELSLTRAEFEILLYLYKNKNRAISREELSQNIDVIDEDTALKSIDVIIGRLRHKLGENPKNPHFIKSVRGIGYRMIG